MVATKTASGAAITVTVARWLDSHSHRNRRCSTSCEAAPGARSRRLQIDDRRWPAEAWDGVCSYEAPDNAQSIRPSR